MAPSPSTVSRQLVAHPKVLVTAYRETSNLVGGHGHVCERQLKTVRKIQTARAALTPSASSFKPEKNSKLIVEQVPS